MEAMRESWTDARLDDFAAHVDKRFDKVEAELKTLSGRFDALNRTLMQIGGGIIGTLIAGIFGIIMTQL